MLNCNSANNTLKVVEMISKHKPKTAAEVVMLIKEHQKGGHYDNCGTCSARSKGTLEDFARNLYEKQKKFFASLELEEICFEYECCYRFMYALFVTNSLKGSAIEDNVVRTVNQDSKKYGFNKNNIKAAKGSDVMDFKYGVDVVIMDGDSNIKYAIQVKPISYLSLTSDGPVVMSNKRRNAEFTKDFGVEVFYLYYDKDSKYTNYHILLNILTEGEK